MKEKTNEYKKLKEKLERLAKKEEGYSFEMEREKVGWERKDLFDEMNRLNEEIDIG